VALDVLGVGVGQLLHLLHTGLVDIYYVSCYLLIQGAYNSGKPGKLGEFLIYSGNFCKCDRGHRVLCIIVSNSIDWLGVGLELSPGMLGISRPRHWPSLPLALLVVESSLPGMLFVPGSVSAD